MPLREGFIRTAIDRCSLQPRIQSARKRATQKTTQHHSHHFCNHTFRASSPAASPDARYTTSTKAVLRRTQTGITTMSLFSPSGPSTISWPYGLRLSDHYDLPRERPGHRAHHAGSSYRHTSSSITSTYNSSPFASSFFSIAHTHQISQCSTNVDFLIVSRNIGYREA